MDNSEDTLLHAPAEGAQPVVADGAKPKRVINVLTLVCLTYMSVSGGPYGFEDAVSAAGPLVVIICVLVLPFLWGIPQAVMTAELSTMIDENGGYILWVRRGMGEFPCWMCAMNSLASNLCDLPTYPVLFSSYLQTSLMPDMPMFEVWLIRLAGLVLIVILNVRGMQAVGSLSVVFTFIIVLPFLLEIPIAIPHLKPANWLGTVDKIDWAPFVSTLLWNYQGWDSLGCIAGEVNDGGRTYPLGIGIALILIVITYLAPVAVGVSLDPNLSNWSEGYFETLARRLAPWLSGFMLAGSTVANLGEFNVVMSTTSRALWAMARLGFVPRKLSWTSRKYGTPVGAILMQASVAAGLMWLDFSSLVLVDTFFNNVSLLLEAIAFIRLRYIEPDTPRPYKAPGGFVGLWVLSVPKLALLVLSLFLMGPRAWVVCGTANLLFVLAYLVWLRYQPRHRDRIKVPDRPDP